MISKRALFPVFILLVTLCTCLTAQEIHEAAQKGELVKVKTILAEHPESIHTKDEGGRTPLHWASWGAHELIVKMLVDAGADVNVKDNNNYTPLHLSCRKGDLEVSKLLIDKGADIHAQNWNDSTPLHTASISGNDTLVRFLIGKGASVDSLDKQGRNPLCYTARDAGHVNVIKVLIKAGADVNLKDLYGESPIMLAAWRGYRKTVELLFREGANLPSEDSEKERLLSYSLSLGLHDLFFKLMEVGTDYNKVGDPWKGNLLHAAALGGSVEIGKFLIKQGIDMNNRDFYGWTPLHVAADCGNTSFARLLLDSGIDMNAKTPVGETAYHFAKTFNHFEITDLLKSKRADPGESQFLELEGDYLGQKRPGIRPELFAKGVVSGRHRVHSTVVFSPDGKEAYWCQSYPDPVHKGYTIGKIMTSSRVGRRWTYPRFASFSGPGTSGDVPFFSPDNRKLYFISSRPLPGSSASGKENIWVVEREGDEWSEPKPIGEAVNRLNFHWQFSVDSKQNLFLVTSVEGKRGLYRIPFVNNEYTSPEYLGEGGHPFIVADRSYLLFQKDFRLYVRFRDKAGNWSEAQKIELGADLDRAYCPIVSPDGQYLFFIGHQDGLVNVYWVDAKIIEDLKPKELK